MKKLKAILSFVFALGIICLGFSFAFNFDTKITASALSQTEIVENIMNGECVEKGGAIYLSAGSTYNMSGGEISGHFAEKGGALYISDGAVFTMTGGTITGNYAKYGGAIYVANGGECYINGGTITGNYGMNAPAIYVETGGLLQVSDEALVDGNIFLEKTTPINVYVDGTLAKTINAGGESYTLKEADMPLDYEHCCGYFLDSELRTTIKNDTIDLTSVGEEITFTPRTATAGSEGINIYTRTANPESDFSFTYDSSTQTYKIGLSNKDVEGIVVLPKEYDNVQTSIDYYGSDEMSYFEFNNEVNLCLQSGVLTIPECAFFYVYNLKSITIPDSVTSIGYGAFGGCNGLTSVIIPDGVTSIGDFAFQSCTGLTGELIIPNSVTSIGNGAFFNCVGLTGELIIPDNVTIIGKNAFYNCVGLTEVKVTNGNTIYEDRGKNAIIEKSTNTIIYGHNCTDLSVLEEVTIIGDYAFYGCSGLTGELIIPDSVTIIGDYAFMACMGLTSLTIGNRVTSIGDYAFQDCIGLTSLTIPNSVTSIGERAFSYCSGLTSVYIPSSVTTISASSYLYAPFSDCSSSLVIYTDVANASSKPSGWSTYWNYRSSNATYTTNYGYTLEQYKSAVGLTFAPNGEKVNGAEVEAVEEDNAYRVDNSYLNEVILNKNEYIAILKENEKVA